MYILEGNIGVGKSTFLTLLNKHLPQIETILEPVNNWNNEKYGQSLLGNFYKNPKRWAYTLETLAMISRSREHIKEQSKTNQNRIFERSVYSGHYCFAYNGHESGYFSQVEWEIYNQWVEFLLQQRCRVPIGFIYLKADPEVCYKRVQKRARGSEDSLSLDYMKKIDERHDAFLIKKQDIFEQLKSVPVLTLDCNEDFVKNTQNLEKHLTRLTTFLQETQLMYPQKTDYQPAIKC